jgi:hypothetical protein
VRRFAMPGRQRVWRQPFRADQARLLGSPWSFAALARWPPWAVMLRWMRLPHRWVPWVECSQGMSGLVGLVRCSELDALRPPSPGRRPGERPAESWALGVRGAASSM